MAVSVAGDKTYGLEGFADGEAAFNNMISDAKVEIGNASQAESFTRFYMDCVYGNANNIVYDELRLRHKVEDHFVGYAELRDAGAEKVRHFRQWWDAYKARSVGRLAPTVSDADEDHYLVLVDILEMTVGRRPELEQWSVNVRKDGNTRLLAKHLVFASSSTSSRSDSILTNFGRAR